MAQWIVLEAYEGAQGDLAEGQIIDDGQYPFTQMVAAGLLACPYTSTADATIAAWRAQANPSNTALTEYLLNAGYPIGTSGVGSVPASRQVIAGAGLTGGGTLAADRTFDVVAGNVSLIVSANSMVAWSIGATGARPASPAAGQAYYDTTLSLPIWYNGTAWTDATNTPV